MSKVCRICNIEKPFEEFSRRNDYATVGYRNECKPCRTRQSKYLNTFRGHFVQLLGHAKANAAQRSDRGRIDAGVFELTIEDLEDIWNEQQGKCYYSGIPLSYTCNDWRTSLERLDNTKGYIRENVVLCCLECNNIGQWSHEKIHEMLVLIGEESTITRDDFNFKAKPIKKRENVEAFEVDNCILYKCHYCDEMKSVEYYPIKSCSQCLKCKNISNRENRNNNQPRVSMLKLVTQAKDHSKKRNSGKYVREGDFEIDYDYLVDMFVDQKGLCYYSGLPLKFGDYRETNWKCSVERKDPKKDYTKDNVCLVCLEFNSTDPSVLMKYNKEGSSGWSKEKFQYFLKHVKETILEQYEITI